MSFPVVPIESVPTAGLHAAVGDWARKAAEEAFGGTVTELGGELSVRRSGRHLFVSGTLSGVATVPCDRCAEPVGLRLGGELSCLYSPVEAVPIPTDDDEDHSGPVLPDGVPFAAEDVGEYDGVALDLRDVVREYFAVERPPRYRCGDADPASEAACSERWRTRAGPADPSAASPFASLKVLKPPR